MQLAPGTVFAGDYRIERPLSQGGMGAVYVVSQLSTGKPRALKLMHPGLVHDPDSFRRFQQEARVGARIRSEHVVEVQAAGVDPNGVPYLVMELLEGEDLRTRLKRGPLAPDETFTILEQVAHALGAAHDAGVVHRDLKPENIFLGVARRSGASLVVKVLDFGIAKVTEDERRTTAAFGTPVWLSPEQTHKGVITPAADVWAFGLLTFAMITGHFFWRSAESPTGSVATLMSEILYDPIPLSSARAAEFAARVPAGLDAWLARALERDPSVRFPNVRVAFAELAPILRPAAVVQAVAPPPRARGGLVVALVVVALLALAAVAMAAMMYVRARRPAPTAAAAAAPTATATAPATPTATATATPTPTPTATPTASAAPRVQVGGMVSGGDAALKKDVEDKLDESLAADLATCFADDPAHARSGQLVVSLQVAPDGHVASMPSSFSATAGSSVHCMKEKLNGTKFVARSRASTVTIVLIWSSP